MLILNENTQPKIKYMKRYKCAYCNERLTRKELPPHIQRKHEDVLPDGVTPLRAAFNIVNNKEKGSCIICSRESAWNEMKGRYERLCGRQYCTDAYAKMAQKRVKDIYGTDCILKDPRYAEELQKKMLASRKISGTYKFKDGGTVGYTGKYEKNFLEFLDKIMNVESVDITQGPVIYYKYNGKVHMYFSDYYYEPYNLVIEIKDGGENPNNRPMQEYREKQLAKEKAVRDDKKYNYLRLTDNDFGQFMEIMALLKYTLEENPDQKIVKVNESMAGAIGAALAPNPVPYEANKNNFYIVQHMQNNVFNYSITKDPTQNEILSIDPEKGYTVFKMKKEDIPGEYLTFKLKNIEEALTVWNEAIELLNSKQPVGSLDYFYKRYTGKNVLTNDQILFDESCIPIKNFDSILKEESMELYKYFTKPSCPIDLLEEQVSSLEEL